MVRHPADADSTREDLEPSEEANMPLGVNGSTTPARQHLHAPPMLNTTSVVRQLLLNGRFERDEGALARCLGGLCTSKCIEKCSASHLLCLTSLWFTMMDSSRAKNRLEAARQNSVKACCQPELILPPFEPRLPLDSD